MLDKFWNGKFLGLPHAMILVTKSALSRLSDKITTFFVKHNLAECGKSVSIGSGFQYRYPKRISIGNNVILGKNLFLFNELEDEGILVIEDGVSIGNNCRIDFTGSVKVCKDVHLAHFISISTHDHGYDYRSVPVGKSLTIEENVFMGSGVEILHNVNFIGKNAVIGTGSIVTKDVPDYAVVAGNPAKAIGNVMNNK